MRDPNRIRKTLTLLEKFWDYVPDWRLGQVICNIGRWAGYSDPFFLEDDKLVEILEQRLKEAKDSGNEL